MTSTPSMDLAGSISLPSGDVATPSLPIPKAMGMDGPVMSASRTAVFFPLRFMLPASMEVTKDLPTPPLPLMTNSLWRTSFRFCVSTLFCIAAVMGIVACPCGA